MLSGCNTAGMGSPVKTFPTHFANKKGKKIKQLSRPIHTYIAGGSKRSYHI